MYFACIIHDERDTYKLLTAGSCTSAICEVMTDVNERRVSFMLRFLSAGNSRSSRSSRATWEARKLSKLLTCTRTRPRKSEYFVFDVSKSQNFKILSLFYFQGLPGYTGYEGITGVQVTAVLLLYSKYSV